MPIEDCKICGQPREWVVCEECLKKCAAEPNMAVAKGLLKQATKALFAELKAKKKARKEKRHA